MQQQLVVTLSAETRSQDILVLPVPFGLQVLAGLSTEVGPVL